MEHITAYVVDVRTFDALGAADDDVIGGVDTVAAGAVGAEQIVPAVAIHKVGGLTVDGDVLLLVASLTEARLGIEFDEADGAEVGTVAHPQTTCGGIEQQTRVDGVLILHSVGIAHLDSLRPLEIRRLRVEGLVPHREDAAGVTTAEATTGGSVDAEVTVADLQHVGGSTATGTVSAGVPAPAVFRDQASTAGAEGVILTVALGQCRGVVDIGCANLRYAKQMS